MPRLYGGWNANGHALSHMQNVGSAPSEWERLLERLEIQSDAQAIRVLDEGGSEKAAKLRAWISKYAYQKFVPLKVLELAELKNSVEGRFLTV